MLAAAASGELEALVVAGVEPTDFADAASVRARTGGRPGSWSAWRTALSEVTERADVVFPVVADRGAARALS